ALVAFCVDIRGGERREEDAREENRHVRRLRVGGTVDARIPPELARQHRAVHDEPVDGVDEPRSDGSKRETTVIHNHSSSRRWTGGPAHPTSNAPPADLNSPPADVSRSAAYRQAARQGYAQMGPQGQPADLPPAATHSSETYR